MFFRYRVDGLILYRSSHERGCYLNILPSKADSAQGNRARSARRLIDWQSPIYSSPQCLACRRKRTVVAIGYRFAVRGEIQAPLAGREKLGSSEVTQSDPPNSIYASNRPQPDVLPPTRASPRLVFSGAPIPPICKVPVFIIIIVM